MPLIPLCCSSYRLIALHRFSLAYHRCLLNQRFLQSPHHSFLLQPLVQHIVQLSSRVSTLSWFYFTSIAGFLLLLSDIALFDSTFQCYHISSGSFLLADYRIRWLLAGILATIDSSSILSCSYITWFCLCLYTTIPYTIYHDFSALRCLLLNPCLSFLSMCSALALLMTFYCYNLTFYCYNLTFTTDVDSVLVLYAVILLSRIYYRWIWSTT